LLHAKWDMFSACCPNDILLYGATKTVILRSKATKNLGFATTVWP
jgi:hypothetical protein